MRRALYLVLDSYSHPALQSRPYQAHLHSPSQRLDSPDLQGIGCDKFLVYNRMDFYALLS